MLTVHGTKIFDEQGREVLLRGVNLSGSTKTPPDEPTQIVNNFAKHREVSFIGRPFPRESAREHFERLRHWGFNTLRFLITWEAVEHAGRGIYDTDYLDYLAEMVALAGEYGFYVFIDPHQDVWSRMTGGDGAPGWTLEAVGFDIHKLDASEAAVTMQRRYPDYPRMVWTTNYSRLACNTMFTLFFAGDHFAPDLQIDGIPIQEYLQGAFIAAMQQVAARLKDMPHVIGYGPLNEPGKGFIGLNDLNEPISALPHQLIMLTPGESILVGAGLPRSVPKMETNDGFPKQSDELVIANPDGISAWAHGCLWRKQGVWDIDPAGSPFIKKSDFFSGVDFLEDGLLPFTRRYAQAIRDIHPDTIIFLESTPSEAAKLKIKSDAFGTIINAGHWYDGLMLFTKSFDGEAAVDMDTMEFFKGREEVAEAFKQQIKRLVDASVNQMGGVPTLIGEFGLAYDINNKEAFQTDDFSLHELALSMYYDAMDANLVHSTQWNYTPDNSNRWGDNWNEEDLSIFSPDQRTDPLDIHSGGRAIRGFSRPYVPHSGGVLDRVHFDYEKATFTTEITFKEDATTETVIFVPEIWYPAGFDITVTSGTWEEIAPQKIIWQGQTSGKHTLHIKSL